MRRIGPGLAGIGMGIAISVAALWLALRQTSLGSLTEALRGADYRLVIPAVVVYLLCMAARGVCWKSILGHRASLTRVIAALNQGYLLNNILPWRLGELGRAVLLGRHPGLSTASVLASIAVERLFDMTLAVSLLLVMWAFVPVADWMRRAAWLGGLVIAIAALGVWLVLRRLELLRSVLARLPGENTRWMRLLDNLHLGLAALRTFGGLLVCFGWMALSWFLAAFYYWLVLRAFFPSPGWSWAPFTLSVMMLGVAVPSAPAFIGVFEGAGVLALGVFGVEPSSAFAFAVTLHGIYFGITTLLGAMAMAAEGSNLVSTVRAVRSVMSRGGAAPPR